MIGLMQKCEQIQWWRRLAVTGQRYRVYRFRYKYHPFLLAGSAPVVLYSALCTVHSLWIHLRPFTHQSRFPHEQQNFCQLSLQYFWLRSNRSATMNRFGALLSSKQFLLRKTSLAKGKFISSTTPKSSSTPVTTGKIGKPELTAEQIETARLDAMDPFEMFIYKEK